MNMMRSPDNCRLSGNSGLTQWFPDRKEGILVPGKESKSLRGGEHEYFAQARQQPDTAREQKQPFRLETD
jgi:hypothetical protein